MSAEYRRAWTIKDGKVKRHTKRASYREGIAWIAWNDEPEDLDPVSASEYISTGLLADLFGKDAAEVGAAIVRYRIKHSDTP